MSLKFATVSLSAIRGLTWRDTLAMTDAATGAPISLVGVESATMRVRRRTESTVVIFELSTTDGRLLITDAGQGLIAIEVSAVDSLLFPKNGHRRARYVFDVVLSRGGDPEVLEPAAKGRITVNPHDTRLLPEPT